MAVFRSKEINVAYNILAMVYWTITLVVQCIIAGIFVKVSITKPNEEENELLMPDGSDEIVETLESGGGG